MIDTLKRFTQESLFDATAHLLSKLNIQFDREIAEPINVAELYDGPMPQYLTDALDSIDHTYFIGIVNDLSLQGNRTDEDLEAITRMMQRGDKYDGMFIFACDAKSGANLTRTTAAALTRAFNRIACANPVILVIRQDSLLSLATCERLEYSQQWRQGTGEKIGKVCILRNIDCRHPHRGHLDILDSLGDKRYPTFEELYKHWMEVFSSELLTKKFYSELSDWYAWAVQIARFPNDLNTREDDAKFNHEACIRLITRLIFVWFLKQKKLIPEEFFNEEYIRENLIENFNPHDRENLIYNPEKSNYYRLVLQNLFFAMLNCPIVAEGKDVANNRRFRATVTGQRLNRDYNVNNLMRYESEFMEGGAEKFVALANSSVPFLNGGLFDCLDDKPRGLYYDGFSERSESLEQLSLPDYLFFGDEVGRGIDLSQWYGDENRRNVSARGIIDILKRYSFTVEENTPLDQEVSLDPELLGKAFENLLASYNKETQTTARKQTGSFYTPREIVQYMVDESLVAHLKRTCGDDLEPEYRRLLSYATDETGLSEEQRKAVMKALYNCRVLDPACGSGAFPMGVLQQMVHVLRQLDPTNEMWKEFMIDLAIERSRQAFSTEAEEERKARLADIEEAFNRSINDPDYARKLYLIEHCIYGVDIQPIAVQISKLRFFISLVVDQKPTADATHNFGIRPLPNLESKFVAANTLIPVEYDGTLVENNPDVRKYKERLRDLNHKIFLAKRNVDKQRLKEAIKTTRQALANAIEDTGFVGHSEAELLAGWDMFDQNASSSYFDPEWMFGVKGGVDVVIGNPPYISAPAQIADPILAKQREDIINCKKYRSLYQKWDLYVPFIEKGIQLLANDGIVTMIVPYPLTNQTYGKKLREMIVKEYDMIELCDLNGTKVFENVTVSNCIPFIRKAKSPSSMIAISHIDERKVISRAFDKTVEDLVPDKKTAVWNVGEEKRDVNRHGDLHVLGDFCYISKGMVLNSDEKAIDGKFKKADLLSETEDQIHCRKFIEGKDCGKYVTYRVRYLEYNTSRVPDKCSRPTFKELYTTPKLLFNRLGELQVFFDEVGDFTTSDAMFVCCLWSSLAKIDNKSISSSIKKFSKLTRKEMERLSNTVDLRYLLGLMNSHYASVLLTNLRGGDYHIYPEHIRNIPIPSATQQQQQQIIDAVNRILKEKESDPYADTNSLENGIDLIVYHLYGLTYDEIVILDPETPISREEYDNYKAD